jgi:hypothetical protein
MMVVAKKRPRRGSTMLPPDLSHLVGQGQESVRTVALRTASEPLIVILCESWSALWSNLATARSEQRAQKEGGGIHRNAPCHTGPGLVNDVKSGALRRR